MPQKLDQPVSPGQLQESRLFAGVSPDVLEKIVPEVEMLRYNTEEVIFREGEAGDCFFLIIEGAVRISKSGRGGQQETLSIMMPAHFFGEMSLIDGQPRSAQATAVEATILGRIGAPAFSRILEIASRELQMNILRSGVERLRNIDSHFIAELMRNERLSLVGSMANSIIHDLKNPISVIRSCTDMLTVRTHDDAVDEFTSLMKRACNNMMHMTQELLDFARGQTSLQFTRHTSKEVFEDFEEQLVRLLPERVHVVKEIRFADDVNVDLGRFTRMLLNLAKNSVEAMPKGGILRLGLRQEGGWVIFKIADTGCGIPPELQAKVFEPFVTVGKSKGTGLGLAIAKSVAEAHDGQIDLQSKVGLGTTVEVLIPALPVA